MTGRSGKAYADWLTARGDEFRERVQVATLDPFHGYKNAIDDRLEEATAGLSAFNVVNLGAHGVDRCRRRIPQEIHGHRGAPRYDRPSGIGPIGLAWQRSRRSLKAHASSDTRRA